MNLDEAKKELALRKEIIDAREELVELRNLIAAALLASVGNGDADVRTDSGETECSIKN